MPEGGEAAGGQAEVVEDGKGGGHEVAPDGRLVGAADVVHRQQRRSV